jgi:hypothetical protein
MSGSSELINIIPQASSKEEKVAQPKQSRAAMAA